MKRYILTIILCLLATKLVAKDIYYDDICITKNDIRRIYDGDTFYVDIPAYPDIAGKNIGIRINALDTPEIRTRNQEEKHKAIQSRNYLAKLFNQSNKITLKKVKRGKYFRYVADVYVDGQNVAKIMTKKGYGYAYFGGTKKGEK